MVASVCMTALLSLVMCSFPGLGRIRANDAVIYGKKEKKEHKECICKRRVGMII